MADLAVHVDIAASLASLAGNEHVQPDGVLKLRQDLDRYARIIAATRPQVLVETGTRTGASARWFVDHGLDVITVDLHDPVEQFGGHAYVAPGHNRIALVKGDSADPGVAAKVGEMVAGRRCMVSLDSDHSARHVATEIELYGGLVSVGCHLVVEDGIFGYADAALRAQHGLGDMLGSPLDAIASLLAGNPSWRRDTGIEGMHPESHHPAGWWVRHA